MEKLISNNENKINNNVAPLLKWAIQMCGEMILQYDVCTLEPCTGWKAEPNRQLLDQTHKFQP